MVDDVSFLIKALRDLHNDDRDRLVLNWERQAPRMGAAFIAHNEYRLAELKGAAPETGPPLAALTDEELAKSFQWLVGLAEGSDESSWRTVQYALIVQGQLADERRRRRQE
jgi:hypothetical protein